jgi:tetratricopeptide (TPR) repeat protein
VHPGDASLDVLDAVGALLDQSLLRREVPVAGEARETEPRVGMLETIREYALEQLAASGEEGAVRDAHPAYYLSLAEAAEPALRGPEQAVWLDRLEAEHDNLRSALSWTREHGAIEEGLRLAGALWRFWQVHGHAGEGRRWLMGALAGTAGGTMAARARALRGAGDLAWGQGDYGQAVAHLEQSLVLFRALGDRQSSADALNTLGLVLHGQGAYGRAAALYEEALALHRELRNTRSIATALGNLGNVAADQGEYERAVALYEEALALQRELGDRRSVAISLDNLGSVAYDQGEDGRATALHEESLALRRELGDKTGSAYALGNLGAVALQQGEYERAAKLYEESLLLRRALGDKWGAAWALGGLGLVTYHQGDCARALHLQREGLELAREIGARNLLEAGLRELVLTLVALGRPAAAARLGGVAAGLREALGVPLRPPERADHERAIATMRAVLGEDAFAAAWAAGRALPLEEAVALALEDRTMEADRAELARLRALLERQNE